MPPTTKAATAKGLLGHPATVLRQEFILANQEGRPDADILPFKGPLQLPCKEQILKLYFFYREQAGSNNQHISSAEISYKVAKQVIKYWTMAGFKTMTTPRVESHITKLIESYQKVNKNRARDSQTEVKKREVYLTSLCSLFDIPCKDLEEMLSKDRLLAADDEDTRYRVKDGYTRKTEDLVFLADQRGERKMTLGMRDLSYEERRDKNQEKKTAKLGGEVSQESVEKGDREDDSNVEEESDEDTENSSNFSAKSRHKKKSSTVLIELPRDILNNPELVGMLDRTGTTSRKAVGVVSSILKTGKIDGKVADLSNFSISRATLDRKRASNRTVIMEQAMEEFSRNKPVRAALHWDGKLVQDTTGILRENEAILVSGAPHYLEGKLLAVSLLVDEEGQPTSTGEAQALAVLQQVQNWGVEENIVALVFDTTASNSGVHRGATVRLLKSLARPLFFLACRHHVSELIVKACWYCIFENDLSPDCKFFVMIKEDWPSLDTSSEASFMTLPSDVHGKEQALDFYRKLLMKRNKRDEMMVRDDYRELAECAMMLLGETPPSGKISWKKPGACHKARFCAYGIYSLKAFAFSEQLDLDEETIDGLRQFCTFTATIYIPHFLASSIGCDSAANDMLLFKKLFTYRTVDSQLADEALVVLRRHCWYLVPEVVIFSLFSEKLSVDEKSRMASRLLTHKASIPQSYKLEKPKFPVIDESTELVDLVTPHSFKFFNILGLDFSWLEMEPGKWEEVDDFKTAREFVKTVKVTNDVADRGVKLASDFATMLTKDDEMRAMLLQGVERSRKMFPNFKKQTLNA